MGQICTKADEGGNLILDENKPKERRSERHKRKNPDEGFDGMPTDQMFANDDMTISKQSQDTSQFGKMGGHMHQSRNNFNPGDNKKYNTMNTENDLDDEAYNKAVAVLDAKLASKVPEKTGDKGIDDFPGPPLGDMP